MRRLIHDEEGATVVVLGVLMALFLVVVATVVDTGRLYDERGQLQHGVDAAALAVAYDCARDASTCDAGATGVAQEYLDANAKDGTSAVDPTSPLPVNPFIDFGARTVIVDGRSLEPGQVAADGAVTLSLQRQDGTVDAPVRTRAIAEWGSLASGATIPITFSMCDYFGALGWDPANGSPPDSLFPSAEAVIAFHDTSGGGNGNGNGDGDDDEGEEDADACDAHPGHDSDGDGRLPGGFGELEIDAPCIARTTAIDPANPGDPDTWAYQDPGANFGNVRPCLEVGEVYAIPVFVDHCRKQDGTCPPGVDPQQGAYGIGGYAMFELARWRFPGSHSTPPPNCPGPGNSGSCIQGRFVVDIVPTGELGPVLGDFGARSARIIG